MSRALRREVRLSVLAAFGLALPVSAAETIGPRVLPARLDIASPAGVSIPCAPAPFSIPKIDAVGLPPAAAPNVPSSAGQAPIAAPPSKNPDSEESAQAAGRSFDLSGAAGALAAAPGGETLLSSLQKAFEAIRAYNGPHSIRWSPDSRYIASLDPNGRLSAYSWDEKTSEPWIEKVDGFYAWSPRGDAILFAADGRLKLFDVAARSERTLSPYYKDISNIAVSPDGRYVSFQRGDDIWVLPASGGKARRLTVGRKIAPRVKLHDHPLQQDVLSPEDFESYWSPDSKSIAYMDSDMSQVPRFPLVDYAPKRGSVRRQFYPTPGDPLPKPIVAIVSLDGKIRGQELPPDAAYVESIQWTPQGKLAVQSLNRAQNRREVRVDGLSVAVDENPVWVAEQNDLSFLPDGRPVTLSERSGHRHIYIGDRPVTRGDWNVDSIEGIDARGGWITYTGNEGTPLEIQVWRVSFDGKKRERLSPAPGVHQPIVSPDGARFVDSWSSVSQPPVAQPLQTPEPGAAARLGLRKPEFFQIAAEDGTPMDAMLLRPKDFSPAKRYPTIVYTYGGTNLPSVQNRWNADFMAWHNMMTQRGFGVLVLDNTLTGNRSAKAVRKTHGSLSKIEIRDLKTGVDWLKSQPWVDAGRIGLWGWSFGGYLTSLAMTRLTDFAAGAAVAPVTDWRLYDLQYGERRLGMPAQNPKGYEKSSVLATAGGLQRPFMIVHGLFDDNVHFQNTDHFITALDDAGKTWDLRAYPGQRHDIARKPDFMNLFMSLTDFFTKHLGAGGEPAAK